MNKNLLSLFRLFEIWMKFWFVDMTEENLLFWQEKLGEVPGREDFRAGRNEQDSSNNKQQTEQTDNAQGGQ